MTINEFNDINKKNKTGYYANMMHNNPAEIQIYKKHVIHDDYVGSVYDLGRLTISIKIPIKVITLTGKLANTPTSRRISNADVSQIIKMLKNKKVSKMDILKYVLNN